MDLNLLVVAGVSVSTSAIIIFLWDFFMKKNQSISDKKETTCICKDGGYCGYCGDKLCKCNCETAGICTCKEFIESTKSKFSKIKNFFSRPIRFHTFINIPRFPVFRLILQPIFIRIRLAFKNMRITEQTKAEASLYKLAKLLWDQGKYSEADQINSQMLNVRRIVLGDKNKLKYTNS
jgi:hypothetical protein